MSLLRVEDLKVHFPLKSKDWRFWKTRLVHAVDGVSFEIAEGESLGLVGESGCGKSTTARALLSLVKPTDGKIYLNDKRLKTLNKVERLQMRREVQMVFQNPYSSLNPRLTVGEIIAEPLRAMTSMKASARRRRVQEVMELVHLDPSFLNRYPHEFSGGQRQRINIARALAIEPKLLILDEPVSALDVSIQAQIINLLQDLQKDFKLSFLFIAHDLSVVKTLCDRVAVMYLGKIVEMGSTETLYAKPQHPYTQALLSAIPVPDPRVERARKRIPLEGEIPSPVSRPEGCFFHPRCFKKQSHCREAFPPLELKASETQAACFEAQ